MKTSSIARRASLALSLLLPAALAQAAPGDDFGSCLNRLQGAAQAKGVSAASFAQFTKGLQPDMSVLPLLDAQPEFTTPIWDYLAGLVDEQRVADGKARMAEHADLLRKVAARYQVDPATVVAVWGVESDYGRITGKRPLLVSLSTLSCYGRRQSFFQGEFIATLKLLQQGDIRDSGITGSWAGAFGQTQFMPTTYQRLAVDGDGDGRRDVVDSVADAVASTANFLRVAKWSNGHPWGYEVRLPRGFNAGAAGRKNKHAVGHWASLGVTRVDGKPLTGEGPAGILVPAGVNGPAFLVTKNFDAIYSYNAAESYGLAIAVLSDRLRGRPGVQADWPTDDPPLSRAERRDLQSRLIARGYDVGEPDGKVGSKTREAIKDVERQLGMPATGRPGGKVLEALRRG